VCPFHEQAVLGDDSAQNNLPINLRRHIGQPPQKRLKTASQCLAGNKVLGPVERLGRNLGQHSFLALRCQLAINLVAPDVAPGVPLLEQGIQRLIVEFRALL